MGKSNAHSNLVSYLRAELQWQFRKERWLVVAKMNVYHSAIRNSKHYIVPDVTLVKLALPPEEEQALPSWQAERQVPEVVFEVSSEGTWPNEIGNRDYDKPAIYGRIGVKEYYAYDPQNPRVWTGQAGQRLRGWRYENGLPVELQPDEQGRIWSEELDSYLVPDGAYLRLTTREGEMRLTEREAQILARQREEAARKREAEARHKAEAALELAEERVKAEVQAREELERQLAELKRRYEESGQN